MTKRLFVALLTAPTLQKEILGWQERFANLPVRWLAGKNLHITLVPPWYEQDDASVIAKLEKLRGKQKPFALRFEKVTFGPDPRQPRLVWAEGQTPRELIELKTDIGKALAQKSDSRQFLLHLTLARFRPENFLSFPIKKLNEKVSWREEIKSFVLMESHLSSQGADYETLAEMVLS